MEVLHPQCAGLDVHKATVVACVRCAVDGDVKTETRTFGTTTKALLELSDWLSSEGCTHVAMESTGIYWKPIWHILEGDFELVLANATHIKHVPGRKTDVGDARWIADLLAHGLIRGSFVPPTEVQDLRDLTRTRKQLVREVARHTQRIQKTLEDANIKIVGVISDILGQSGRAFLEAIIDGESDPEKLADRASKRLRASRKQLVEALRGTVRDHHRFMLRLHLEQIDSVQRTILDMEERLGERLDPFREPIELLQTMPGVSETSARVLVSEIGADMSRFPTANHLVSWAGLCPRSDESAGKRRSTRIRKGAAWLKTVLVQCAWAAIRKKDCYFRARYHRLRARRGSMKAIIAIAAAMLRAAYHMLTKAEPYKELGPGHFDRASRARAANRHLRNLRRLGVSVRLVTVDDDLADLVSP